jgi:CRISPR/Cas system Type II protein with McrA/HNH and RuvC-like nuclease domain
MEASTLPKIEATPGDTSAVERFRSKGAGAAFMPKPLPKSRKTQGKRRVLHEEQGGKCAYCDRVLELPEHGTLDHVHPKSKGGKNGLANLKLVCPPCNHLKGAIASYQEAVETAARMLAFFGRLRDRGIIP